MEFTAQLNMRKNLVNEKYNTTASTKKVLNVTFLFSSTPQIGPHRVTSGTRFSVHFNIDAGDV